LVVEEDAREEFRWLEAVEADEVLGVEDILGRELEGMNVNGFTGKAGLVSCEGLVEYRVIIESWRRDTVVGEFELFVNV
jgi:hypothetical protein